MFAALLVDTNQWTGDETSETETGLSIGEPKTPPGPRGSLFWATVGCLVSDALMELATIEFLVWVSFNLRDISVR